MRCDDENRSFYYTHLSPFGILVSGCRPRMLKIDRKAALFQCLRKEANEMKGREIE